MAQFAEQGTLIPQGTVVITREKLRHGQVREDELLALGDLLALNFENAQKESGGGTKRFFAIGGTRIRLSFAGPALLPLFTKAFSHLAIPPTNSVDLEISVSYGEERVSNHNGESLSGWLERLDKTETELLTKGLLRGDTELNPNRRIRCSAGPLTLNVEPSSSSIYLLDEKLNRGFFWISDPRLISYQQVSGPLRPIFSRWLRNRSMHMVHGAAAGRDGKGILFAGQNGSGKSTTSLLCMQAGFKFAGDDNVLLGMDPVPSVLSIYGSGKLTPHAMADFPELRPAVSPMQNSEGDKHLIFPHEIYPDRLTGGFRLSAVILPRVSGEVNTKFFRTSSVRGLLALAPHSMMALEGSNSGILNEMSQILASVPHYSMSLGTRREGVLEAVEIIFDQITREMI